MKTRIKLCKRYLMNDDILDFWLKFWNYKIRLKNNNKKWWTGWLGIFLGFEPKALAKTVLKYSNQMIYSKYLQNRNWFVNCFRKNPFKNIVKFSFKFIFKKCVNAKTIKIWENICRKKRKTKVQKMQRTMAAKKRINVPCLYKK